MSKVRPGYHSVQREYWTEALIKYGLMFIIVSAFNYWVLQYFFSSGQSLLLGGVSAWRECGWWLETRRKRIFQLQHYSISVYPKWEAICKEFKMPVPAEQMDNDHINLTFLRGAPGIKDVIYYEKEKGFRTEVGVTRSIPSTITAECQKELAEFDRAWFTFRTAREGYVLELRIPDLWLTRHNISSYDEFRGVSSPIIPLATIPFEEFYFYDLADNDEGSGRLARKLGTNLETARQAFGWTVQHSYGNETRLDHRYCTVHHAEV